ncbi:hypothetical protein UFOVP1119_44 [uncultured Caudovirales phage]|uniref:DpnD/PcfM-like protein n=1 Tax=uncultured Caudovirales phage TaxID=2100421 RepID=A0A6J5RBB6_9CAUD|nr:hypothetical protein UFOVP1119_44 [uncultured Caudovirales phage]CAB4193102.1 hypothetical protein UFOVP1238_18 [uncultured Caudovirales phage]
MPKYKVTAHAITDLEIVVEANSSQEAEQIAMTHPTLEWDNLGYEFALDFTEEVK